MIVTNSTSSLLSGLRKSWIPLYPETFFSAIPEKISCLRRFSYWSAFSRVVHPCQILPITRSSSGCNQLSRPAVVYDAQCQAAGSAPLWPIFTRVQDESYAEPEYGIACNA